MDFRPQLMKVYVSSLHSQVVGTVAKLPTRFGVVLALDSHLDISLGLDRVNLPDELRTIAARTSAHTDIRRLFGELPLFSRARDSRRSSSKPQKKKRKTSQITRFLIVNPAAMFSGYAGEARDTFRMAGGHFKEEDPIEFYSRFVKRYFGADIFLSPPGSLARLLPLVDTHRPCLLDLDFDYVYEGIGECYTTIRDVRPNQLQSLRRLERFVKAARPEVITLSEITRSALNNPESHARSFLSFLRGLGYTTEVASLVGRDRDTLKEIRDTEDYFDQIGRPILRKHARDSGTNEMLADAKSAARTFFTGRGYSYHD